MAGWMDGVQSGLDSCGGSLCRVILVATLDASPALYDPVGHQQGQRRPSLGQRRDSRVGQHVHGVLLAGIS